MTLTFLWTDILIWLLVIATVFWGATLGRSPQIRSQWREIFQSKIALASAVVLSVYFALALLDSVHFKQPISSTDGKVHYSTELESGLDGLFSHLKSRQERTYSAPFATHEYSKSIVTNERGNVEQVYLPLKHVDPNASIALTGVAVFGGLALLLAGIYRWHRNKMDGVIPWKTAYLTLWITLGVLLWAYALSYSYHVFGTDKIGQDVFLQTLKSIRTGVLIGVLTTLVMLPFALLLGISAGYFKGWVDDAIQYLYTTLNSIPGVLLIAAAVLMMQVFMNNHPEWFETVQERADLRLLFLILILGITSWTGLCRMVRAETLKISQVEYVQAARAFGVSHFKILLSHILPNLMHIVIISIVLDFSGLVLAEAVLSYVGVGVDPTMNSWGNMINQARLEMARDPMVWWSLLSAFIFMFCLVLAANLFSDRVQTVLDPRNRKA